MYSWRWITVDGVKRIQKVDYSLIIKGYCVRQIEINAAKSTLGCWFQPNLLWTEEFQQIRQKMIDSVRKLMNTTLHAHMIYTYFHVYMLTLVLFGCGVDYLTEVEESELIIITKNQYVKSLVGGKSSHGRCYTYTKVR